MSNRKKMFVATSSGWVLIGQGGEAPRSQKKAFVAGFALLAALLAAAGFAINSRSSVASANAAAPAVEAAAPPAPQFSGGQASCNTINGVNITNLAVRDGGLRDTFTVAWNFNPEQGGCLRADSFVVTFKLTRDNGNVVTKTLTVSGTARSATQAFGINLLQGNHRIEATVRAVINLSSQDREIKQI